MLHTVKKGSQGDKRYYCPLLPCFKLTSNFFPNVLQMLLNDSISLTAYFNTESLKECRLFQWSVLKCLFLSYHVLLKKGIMFVRYLYRSFLTYSKEYKLYDELRIGSYLKPANLVIFFSLLKAFDRLCTQMCSDFLFFILFYFILFVMFRFSFAFFSLTIIDVSYLF